MEDDWRIYNHTLISTKMPHEDKNSNEIDKLKKWNKKGTLLARWTSDFDCGFDTEWWYCLKDDEFDISSLKSKRRYVINKGIKNFEVKEIEQNKYLDEMYAVYKDALLEYPDKYRSIMSKDEFKKNYENDKKIFIGAWDKETGDFSGYAICLEIKSDTESVIDFQVVKVKRNAVSKEINAAIANYICCRFLNEEKVKYIFDGERNIRHITNFQDYLIKYFGFRKAYCKLNIKYKFLMNIIVNILYPFKNIFKNTNNKFLYNVYCILCQEQIRRSFKS